MLTGYLVRAGRSLIGMSQGFLSEISGVPLRTIQDVEYSKKELRLRNHETVSRIQNTLEAHGVVFVFGEKPGVFHDLSKDSVNWWNENNIEIDR